MAHQSRDATSDVNHEIRKFYQTDHKIKEVGIVFKIPVTHHTDIMKIWSENLRIFKDSSILNNCIITLGDFYYIMKSLIQEIDLQVERPSFHILVIISQIGIIINRFEIRFPTISFAQ